MSRVRVAGSNTHGRPGDDGGDESGAGEHVCSLGSSFSRNRSAQNEKKRKALNAVLQDYILLHTDSPRHKCIPPKNPSDTRGGPDTTASENPLRNSRCLAIGCGACMRPLRRPLFLHYPPARSSRRTRYNTSRRSQTRHSRSLRGASTYTERERERRGERRGPGEITSTLFSRLPHKREERKWPLLAGCC